MMFRKFVGLIAVMFLVSGCVTNPDGSTANIFSDLETLMSGNDVAPEQSALHEQSESYNDYAEARIASAAVGALVGGLIGLAAGDEEGALIGAVAGGVAGYVGGSYLTRDHSEFDASQEALDEDIAIAQELTASSRQNVRVARAALAYQKQEVAHLNEEYESGLINAETYESALRGIARDRESVKSMIATTEVRIASMNQSITSYRSAGYDTSQLAAAKAAQERDFDNLRKIEDAMVAMISGAPDGIQRPTV